MLKALEQWLGFAAKKGVQDEKKLAICLRTLIDAPPATSLHDKIIVVCRGSQGSGANYWQSKGLHWNNLLREMQSLLHVNVLI